MTYTPVQNRARYQSYQEYLDDESLSTEINHRLLSTGELIEVASEDDMNLWIAIRLMLKLAQIEGGILADRVRNGNKELQVRPIGDKWVNRIPDLMVMQTEHLEIARKSILIDMVPPLLVAEVVSPGSESSINFKRDYVWKKEQYAELGIPEYWIIDPHREKVTVLSLNGDSYQEAAYVGTMQIESQLFPSLSVTVNDLLVR
ncbi:MAG: Uma2 family endonuclease [Cyanobacteria bacterium J06560_2]